MTYFLLRDYNILPRKELPLSPWVKHSWDLSVSVAAVGVHQSGDGGDHDMESSHRQSTQHTAYFGEGA